MQKQKICHHVLPPAHGSVSLTAVITAQSSHSPRVAAVRALGLHAGLSAPTILLPVCTWTVEGRNTDGCDLNRPSPRRQLALDQTLRIDRRLIQFKNLLHVRLAIRLVDASLGTTRVIVRRGCVSYLSWCTLSVLVHGSKYYFARFSSYGPSSWADNDVTIQTRVARLRI
jgi:hypothetical protein